MRVLNLRLRLPPEPVACEPETHLFEWPDGTRIGFDPNGMGAVHVQDDGVWAKIKAGRVQDTGLSPMIATRLKPYFQRPAVAPLARLVLNLTHNCNLKCSYCFARQHARNGQMPLDTALAALAMFPEKSVLDLCFFGGEPMLAWDTMIAVAEKAQAIAAQRKSGCRLHMTTNATLIDAAKAAVLKRHNFGLLVSLDGPQDIHDACRGEHTHAAALAGLKHLRAAGYGGNIGIRATYPPQGLRDFRRRLDHFAALRDESLLSSAAIEPAVLSEGCRTAPDATGFDAQAEATEWHDAAAWYVERFRARRPFAIHYFQKLLKRIAHSEFHGQDCGAGRGYLTIGPDGAIYACHRESGSLVGDVVNGFDDGARKPWWEQGVWKHPECSRCWARYLCGGGCPQARTEVGGSLTAPTPTLCEIRRIWIAETFWIMAQLTREELARIVK